MPHEIFRRPLRVRFVWARLGGLSGFIAVSIYLFGHATISVRIPALRKLAWGPYCVVNAVITQGLLGSDFPARAQIGGGLVLPHGAAGIFIQPDCIVGSNVTIFQQVTIGTRYPGVPPPVIEDGVFIGAGAKILGDIRVGAGAKIGANAVVLANVPAKATAVGVPARIVSDGSRPDDSR